jgi:hypothetical protein
MYKSSYKIYNLQWKILRFLAKKRWFGYHFISVNELSYEELTNHRFQVIGAVISRKKEK